MARSKSQKVAERLRKMRGSPKADEPKQTLNKQSQQFGVLKYQHNFNCGDQKAESSLFVATGIITLFVISFCSQRSRNTTKDPLDRFV